MHDDLTPGTERALAAATTWAHRLSAESVAPLHVLLGLLDEPEGAAAALLRRAGLDIDQWRAPYLANPIPMESPSRPLSPQVMMALGTARSLARDHAAERAISTELLAIALVQIDAGLVADLTAAGLKSSELLERIATEPGHYAPDEPLDLSDPVEQADAARILDASANRAREALRVLEDFARFSRDDAGLSRDIKAMRHDLAEALEELPGDLLLASRDTQADVGTEIHAERELTRHSLTEVVLANLKRLQESLRSLEEVGKIYGSQLGQRLKRLRYKSYTLERVILLNAGVRERLAEARLYVLLSGATCRAALDWTIAEAAAGGAQIIQLREKDLDDRELIERARNVRRWTNRARVLFIMNDRPDIARLVGADGVHLGQTDLSVRDAGRILGPHGIIGVSTHDLDQVKRAVHDRADYIGVGPTFPSATKQFHSLSGLEFVRAAVAETSLPAFVLGGVTAENVPLVVEAGAKRIAVSAAIAQADDPRAAAAKLRRALD
jgi:thiamine-phosphate pyrophosphorylase